MESSEQALLEQVAQISKAHETARKLYADQLAPDFNFLDFATTNEVGLSAILAWLLDPNGSHAQGSVFLAQFLNDFAEDFDDDELCRVDVACEATISDRRRIDILVRSGRWAFGIENKLRGAPDQPGQVQDYLIQLASIPECYTYRLIYLTIDGDDPGADSIACDARVEAVDDGVLVPMAVASLYPWLTRCRALSRSPRITSYIDDLKRFCERELEGKPDMSETNDLIASATESASSVAAAMKIAVAADDIRQHLFRNLADEIAARCKKPGSPYDGWQVTRNADVAKYNPNNIALVIKPQRHIVFGFDNRTSFNYPYIGVYAPGLPPGTAADMKARLDHSIAPSNAEDESFPWALWIEETTQLMSAQSDWRKAETPWVEIVDGQMAERVLSAALQIHSNIGNTLAREGR